MRSRLERIWHTKHDAEKFLNTAVSNAVILNIVIPNTLITSEARNLSFPVV